MAAKPRKSPPTGDALLADQAGDLLARFPDAIEFVRRCVADGNILVSSTELAVAMHELLVLVNRATEVLPRVSDRHGRPISSGPLGPACLIAKNWFELREAKARHSRQLATEALDGMEAAAREARRRFDREPAPEPPPRALSTPRRPDDAAPKSKQRGRPFSSPPTADARILAAWRGGSFKKIEDLARELGKSPRDVRLALDRVRKRLRQRRNK